MILYDGWTLYDIKTPLHLFDTKRKSGRRVGVNAPPRTRAKIGQGYPSERQSDTATPPDKPENEPTSDFLTPPEEWADSDKKTRHEATHAATVPPRADERQERQRKDTAGTTSPAKNRPERPPKPSDARRTPRGRHSDTTRTRPHITNGGGYARTRAIRV